MKNILSLILSLMLIFQGIAYANTFNPQNVYNTIKEFTQEKYAGRLAGDKGNELACEYVNKKFLEAKLLPLGDDKSFYQYFTAYVPSVEGDISFKVFDGEKLIKEYAYGIDYKEIYTGASVGGLVKGKLYSDEINKGEIYVGIDYPYETMSTYEFDKELVEKGVKAALYFSERAMNFKSTYKIQNEYKEGLIKLMVDSRLYDEIKDFSDKGYIFEIKSPVKIKRVKTKNIVGIKKAASSEKPPIIFSAHIDHVGYDAGGRIYPGALDNASGVAFMLEILNVLKDVETNRDIIFIAFNAEEEGLIGSYYFVNRPPINIENAECINFDMIGSPKEIPLSALSSSQRSDELNAFVNEQNLNRLYEDNSDHAPFNMRNISAVTLIHDDMEKIHTTFDTIENIDVKKIEEAYKTVEKYLLERGILLTKPEEKENAKNTYLVYAALIPILAVGIYFGVNRKKSRI